MLAYALRRLLWTVPALIGISIVTFLLLSFVPDPADDPARNVRLDHSELEALRRERYLDLPRFLNVAPIDARERGTAIVAAFERGGPEADAARSELVRLGGAVLPFVLPRLQELEPDRRVELALALAPVARRMGFTTSDVTDPARAVGFWTRFWDDRGVEFRRASVRSSVSRLERYGSSSRANDLIELDTFALDDVLAELTPPDDEAGVRRARALTDVAAHMTDRDDRIKAGASLADARAVVMRWRAFWSVYRTDFTSDVGMDRVAASVLETRYGKWAYEAVTDRFGRGAPGERPVLDELSARVPVTLALVTGAVAIAYAIAIPLGALAAAYKRQRINALVMLTVLVAYAVPTAVIAVIARTAGGFRHARRDGRPRGSPPRSAHGPGSRGPRGGPGLRRGDGGSRTRRGVGARCPDPRDAERPPPRGDARDAGGVRWRLGGAFVVERVFGLRGIGEATIAAVGRHDTGWLMAISMVAALIAAIVAVAGDILAATIDPRLRAVIVARRGQT